MCEGALPMQAELPVKMDGPPMPPIRLDHIAIALPRIAEAPAALVAVLGGVPDNNRPSATFRWATWRFAGGATIEVLEPIGPDGFLHRFLAARGRGIHHVTFKVPDLAEACARVEEAGYDIVGRDESDRSWKEAFLHPKQALGIVVQIVESETAAASDPPASVPFGLPEPPPPVRILGLRLYAQSRPRALTQWSQVLRGAMAEDRDGSLEFRWPDSPMCLAVDIDPTAAEGPIALEIAAERSIPSLEAAGARLGIRILPRSC
jgi:catechol 2,3-dioxygenase-like lactoylglutathione lyase family enzyme